MNNDLTGNLDKQTCTKKSWQTGTIFWSEKILCHWNI